MQKNKYDICIVGGLGHIGLPLAILFAKAGKKVVVYDLYEKNIEMVSRGEMPFMEQGAEKVLKKVINKNLSISSDKKVLGDAYFIIVVIGTPADRHLNPEFAVFKKFIDEVMDIVKDEQHIILRSTVFPGTTENLERYLRSKGKKTKLSVCPERIVQGRAMEELQLLPQIIGSSDKSCQKEAGELFSLIAKKVIYLNPLEAELAKLFCNVWRYIQFSIGNQFYQIAVENNVDFYKIHDAITYDYPRAKAFTKAGFTAGPCLFKDTAHLVALTGNTFFLGNAAMLVNEGLPNFIVHRLKEKYPLNEKTVGILGMAFKANSDDKRDSLSFKLKHILETQAKSVLCSDFYIKSEKFVGTEELIQNSDIIIIGVPHSEYGSLKIPDNKILVDVWNFFGKGGLF
ncbi:MAG: nucleotide sugar dehydrogenase [Candidatus Omnitrophica bacterium]|nr:nucleotide sugar dehydrogenase [Candidatus Omnitrophota bacterium]